MFKLKKILIIMMAIMVSVISMGCSSSGSSSKCAEPGCNNTRMFGSSFCSSHQDIANAIKNR